MSSDVYNNEAEQFTLAAILRNPKSYFEINAVGLVHGDFSNVQHIQVFEAIELAVSDKSDPTVPYVIENLRDKGRSAAVEYVGELHSVPSGVVQATDFARVIKALSVTRKLQDAGAEIIDIASEKRQDYVSVIAEATSILRAVEDEIPRNERSPDIKDILKDMDDWSEEDSTPISFSNTLQSMTGGFTPGHYWVIGAFTSVGKSAFSSNIVNDCIMAGKTVAIVSAEMTQKQYVLRLLSIKSGISWKKIASRVTIGIENNQSMIDARKELEGSKLYVYDNLYRMPQIRTEMQRLKNKEGLDIFILDYIQNVSVTGDEVSDAREVALECQRLAKDLSCTVIAFSQLSNAQAKYELEGGDDNYYSLKGHGAIRDAADVILTLHRDQAAQSSALKVKFRKNRHGPISDFRCHFDLTNGRIAELEWEDE